MLRGKERRWEEEAGVKARCRGEEMRAGRASSKCERCYRPEKESKEMETST